MTVTSRRKPRDQALLHRLAAPFEPVRAPYYVAAPSRPGEAAGWHWIPAGAGAGQPQILGSNVFMAQRFLEELAQALPDRPGTAGATE